MLRTIIRQDKPTP